MIPEPRAVASWLQVDFSDHGGLGFDNGHSRPVETAAEDVGTAVPVAGGSYSLNREIN